MVLSGWFKAAQSKQVDLVPVVEEQIRVQDRMSQRYPDTHVQRSSPQPIRIGVIGVGNMGQHHAR
ncbi:MAG TPA: gfo/Idh/MocA family oxidoreductase, partial [Coleofasciculaceae cyanobacterium]